MRLILNFFIGLGLLSLVAAGCGDGEPDSDAETSVVATTTQVTDLVRNVAGDRAAVSGILAANSDPHEYEPKPSDATAVSEADLIVDSGGDLDPWLNDLIAASGSEAPELTLIDSVDTLEGEDPHWWQNPTNAVAAVETIRDELSEIDPGGADEYAANADVYIKKLDELDRSIADCMDGVPAAQRKLVTSHDALGYYADRYGVEIIGAAIPALTTQAQPSAGETAALVDLIRSEGVSAVFPEAGVSAELEEAIATEAGASIGGELWADALGPEGSDGDTYIKAMEANTAKLIDGFTGGERTCEIDVEGS